MPEHRRRSEVDALFSEALEHPAAERADFLEQACGGDQALRGDVERLLASSEAEDPFFHTGGALGGALGLELQSDLERSEALLRDARVGPYRVVGEIGRGGMAVVYEAERTDGQFEQRVALKLLKLGDPDEKLVRRFARERQILASLQHPNIARLLDGGVSDGGHPYFAMERIEGLSIDRYADSHRLTVEERLRLFVDVARAVESAHRMLVVHRDLKPSNILVDQSGQAKLLDFGIAKLLDPGTWDAEPTRSLHMMTPEYASPEQVRGEPVTTAADIYQLGLLLYELLTGQRAHGAGERSPAEWVRAVCDKEPTRPSTAVSPGSRTAATTSEAISRARRTQPANLRRTLTGDLDQIILKALRKEPKRRYASVGHLAEDVERFLSGHPVLARQGTFGYKTWKFVRRHAAAVGAVALAALLVAAVVFFYAVRLATERDRAELEAHKAQRISEFLADLFEGSDPYRLEGAETTARELLERGAGRVRAELADEPEAQASLMAVIGDVYRKLGLYTEARPLLETSLERRRSLLGEEHPETLESLLLLGRLRRESGEYSAARELFETALKAREQAGGAGVPEVLTELAETHRLLSDFPVARDLYERALAHPGETGGGENGGGAPLTTAETLASYGLLLRQLRAYGEAIPIYRRALDIRRRELGEEHPLVGETLTSLARAVRYKEGPAEARPLYERALAILRASLGSGHPSVATALDDYGLLLLEVGEIDAGRETFEKALAVREEVLGPDHPEVAITLSHLAKLEMAAGRFATTRALYERAIAIRESALGREDAELAAILSGYADLLYHGLGDAEAALPVYRRAVELRRKNLGEDHSFVGLALHGLTRLLVEQGAYEEAEPLLRQALSIVRRTYSSRHWIKINILFWLGQSLTYLERFEEAEPFLLEAWETLEGSRYFEEGKREGVELIAALYDAWGRPEEGVRYRAALEPGDS